jgi:hypothetical protein
MLQALNARRHYIESMIAQYLSHREGQGIEERLW